MAREVALRVHETGKLGHGEERACRVENVDVEERDERHPQLARAKLTETQHPRRLLDLVDVHHLLEVLVRGVAGGRVGEVRHLQIWRRKHTEIYSPHAAVVVLLLACLFFIDWIGGGTVSPVIDAHVMLSRLHSVMDECHAQQLEWAGPKTYLVAYYFGCLIQPR